MCFVGVLVYFNSLVVVNGRMCDFLFDLFILFYLRGDEDVLDNFCFFFFLCLRRREVVIFI